MTATITQPVINVREELNKNKQVYGIKGKQILESDTVSEVRSLLSIGRKNIFINGDFDIWQRGTSQTNSGVLSDDRWENGIGGSTQSVTREVFTPGQTKVPGNPKYFSRTAVTSAVGASNLAAKWQNVENVVNHSNKTITASFWAKADSNIDIATEFYQYYGSGGSPSGVTSAIGVETFSLTTEWKKFTTSAYIPSTNGKTLGTDGNDFFAFIFWFESGTVYAPRNNSLGHQSGIFDIAQVQVEASDQATEFEQRHISEELKLCQRYFQKSYNIDITPGDAGSEGAIFELGLRNHLTATVGANFKTTMRAIPTITTYSVTNGTPGTVLNGANGDVPVTSINNVSTTGWPTTIVSGALTTNGCFFHYTADAEL